MDRIEWPHLPRRPNQFRPDTRLGGFNQSSICIPSSPLIRYIPGTSFTLHSGHIDYTFGAYRFPLEVVYALEGEQCHGEAERVVSIVPPVGFHLPLFPSIKELCFITNVIIRGSLVV